TCDKPGEWYPILLPGGIQAKNIVEKSENLLSEGERPIVLDRGTDYEIDYAGGRFRAIDGGRVELGKLCSLSFRFSNSGPALVDGKNGKAASFDGVNDY